MSKARVGVVIIRKRKPRFFSGRGEAFSLQKDSFFPWALLAACRKQIEPILPCPTLPITNQWSKGLTEGKINRRNHARKACRVTWFPPCFLS